MAEEEKQTEQKQVNDVKKKKTEFGGEQMQMRTLAIEYIPENLLTKLERWAQIAVTLEVEDLETLGLLWPNAPYSDIKIVQKYIKNAQESSPISNTSMIAKNYLEQVDIREFVQTMFRLGLQDCGCQLTKVSDEIPF